MGPTFLAIQALGGVPGVHLPPWDAACALFGALLARRLPTFPLSPPLWLGMLAAAIYKGARRRGCWRLARGLGSHAGSRAAAGVLGGAAESSPSPENTEHPTPPLPTGLGTQWVVAAFGLAGAWRLALGLREGRLPLEQLAFAAFAVAAGALRAWQPAALSIFAGHIAASVVT